MLRSPTELLAITLFRGFKVSSARVLLSSIMSNSVAVDSISRTAISGRTISIWFWRSSNFSSIFRVFHATCLYTLFFSFSCSSSLWLGLVRGPDRRICFAWLVALLMPRGTWFADVFLAKMWWTFASETRNKSNLQRFIAVIFESQEVLWRLYLLFPYGSSGDIYRVHPPHFIIICCCGYLSERNFTDYACTSLASTWWSDVWCGYQTVNGWLAEGWSRLAWSLAGGWRLLAYLPRKKDPTLRINVYRKSIPEASSGNRHRHFGCSSFTCCCAAVLLLLMYDVLITSNYPILCSIPTEASAKHLLLRRPHLSLEIDLSPQKNE